MKKAKKVLALVLVLALTVALSVAGTIAYLSDKDGQVNTFVTGNVAIDLWEDFDNDGDGLEKLMPVTYNEDGTRREDNVVEKEVYVTNDGSEDAYVRVHIAIPTILDDGDPNFNAAKNTLHFNYEEESVGEGKWNWSKGIDTETGDNWNFYTTTIDNVGYNVYVVTYETALAKDEQTVDAMSQVYLDHKVTNETITGIKQVLGENWYIYVAAEGTQKAGFNDAYDALNTTFGVPGDYHFDWATVATTGKTLVDLD